MVYIVDMDNEFNFGEFINRHAEEKVSYDFLLLTLIILYDCREETGALSKMINQEKIIYTASSTISATDVDSIDFNSELHRMEREINYYKTKLQSCRDKYTNLETEICDVKRLQRKALFVLDNVQLEEEDIHQRLKDIHLSYETCVEKSDGDKDRNETIRATISELAIQRKTLMEELTQLKKNANDNNKKLARVNTMIAEQEEKNAILLRELKKKSNAITIPQDIKERIDTILNTKKGENDKATNNMV